MPIFKCCFLLGNIALGNWLDRRNSSEENKMDELTDPHYWGFMGFNSIQSLLDYKFEGAVKVCDWKDFEKPKSLDSAGVYLIVRNNGSDFEFEEQILGEVYQESNSKVPKSELSKKWVKETCVMYIGKAGGAKYKQTLRKRLDQYMNYRKGKSKNHKGGRYIWHLPDCDTLEIYWLKLCSHEPVQVERALINAFLVKYNQLPFANLR